MRIMQRVVMIVLLVVLFCFGRVFVSFWQEEKLLEQWEKVQTERFMLKLCRDARCTYEDILLYVDVLNHNGNVSEIRLEEFKQEVDEAGKRYYFLISWEELQKLLLTDGVLEFDKDSILVVTINRYNRLRNTENKYYDAVFGKG